MFQCVLLYLPAKKILSIFFFLDIFSINALNTYCVVSPNSLMKISLLASSLSIISPHIQSQKNE